MSEIGAPKQGPHGPMNIGEEAKPTFAVLPNPSVLFLNRSKRLAALPPKHELEPSLKFLATLTRAQHDILADLPEPALPPLDQITKALAHGMPPVSRASFEPDDVAALTVERLLARLASEPVPEATATAISALREVTPAEGRQLILGALKDPSGEDDLARRVLLLAGLQVHFTRLATMLAANDLKPVADGACPVCGSAPMTSSVVGWPKAHNTRFCACSLCGTMWNVVRIKCVLCSSTGGIRYHEIEGKPDTIKGETCDTCHSYVKILYQVNDAALDPLADDVASLALDILLIGEGWN